MRDSDFFHLIDDPEIGDEAYAYLFSFCDRVRYLGGYRTEADGDDLAEELRLGPYADAVPALLTVEEGDDWNMEGTYLTFSLSEPVKRMVRENSLGGMVRPNGGEGICLENLSLWKGEKRLYAVCSHEGYTDANETFSDDVGKFCLDKIAATECYAAMKEKFAALSALPARKVREGYRVLTDLPNYVSAAIGDWFYCKPSRACTYKRFLALAGQYLTADVVDELEKAGSFAGLHPAGAPDMALMKRDIEAHGRLLTQEQREAILRHPRFSDSPLAVRVKEELDLFKVVFYRETGDWFRFGWKPTLILRQ